MSSSTNSSNSTPLTQPLAAQVGGHAGVHTTFDGALLIKPVLPTELAFYQGVLLDERCAALRPFVPRCFGTLHLEGRVALAGEEAAGGALGVVRAGLPRGEPQDECTRLCAIVLENLCHAFVRPNVVDIKLGTVLFDAHATPEKRAKMERTARETTSGAAGVRLTGFQVYDNDTGQPVLVPKIWGRSIQPAHLPAGIAYFFPIAGRPSSPSAPPPLPLPVISAGLPAHTLLPLLEGIRTEVEDLRGALAGADLSVIGASLLVVYEAEWAAAAEGVRMFLEDGEEGMEEDGISDEDGDENEDPDEDSDEDSDISLHGPHPPFTVKLIDFAHTRPAPVGAGPPAGVLQGLDKVLALLDARIADVARVLDEEEHKEHDRGREGVEAQS